MLDDNQIQNIDAWYKESRTEAKEWHRKRTEYMLSRLKSGKYPELDEGFWNDLQEIEPTPLDGDNTGIIAFISLLLILMVGARLIVVFFRRKSA